MNNQKELIKTFIKRVKLESTFHKFLEENVINQLINIFDDNYKRKNYLKQLENSLELALQFYKHYNEQYYNMILDAIKNKKIIIDKKNKSFINRENNITSIRLIKNDSDLFMLVHEFAHFIDRNSQPHIIPNRYWFLSEVFSFYMEKQLENWLNQQKYEKLIQIRRNNRMYFESKMMKAVEYEFYYEKLYNQTGKIDIDKKDINKIQLIMSYDYDLKTGLINQLLCYPIANILSEYLIRNHFVKNDYDIYKICLNTDLYDLLKNSPISQYKK